MLIVILSALLFWSDSTFALDLRICNIDSGFGKYSRPDMKGTWQIKLKEALKLIDANAIFHFMPRKRCLLEVEQNDTDAIFSTVNTNRLPFLVYPKTSSGDFDNAKSLDKIVFKIFKLNQEKLDWNGSKFTQVENKIIGVQRGIYAADLLPQYISNSPELLTSNDQLFSMLQLKRLNAIIVESSQADEYFTQNPNLKRRVLAIKTPFNESYVYLAFSKKFYEKNPKIAEDIWNQLAKLNKK